MMKISRHDEMICVNQEMRNRKQHINQTEHENDIVCKAIKKYRLRKRKR